MKKIVLKSNRAASLRRFHPWVFSGAIDRKDKGVRDGDIVQVYDGEGVCLGSGHYTDSSICVRILSHSPVTIDADFFAQRIANAYAARQKVGLPNPHTNCYRLIHAEGDGLPGLIIDIYGDTAVVQCHSIGMVKQLDWIISGLQATLGTQLKAIYNKSAESLPRQFAAGVENGYVFGESQPQVVLENGHSFFVDWETGQKTGFFLDQRDNRALLGKYTADRRVLNAFSYSGGFSIYALKNGATHVDSVDASAKAIDWTNHNVALENGFAGTHAGYASDVLEFLKEQTDPYDTMVIDPPAFAKTIKKRHNAVQGYKRLNAAAMRHVKSGGILFTFSCSQVIDAPLFQNTIVAAALEVGRPVRLLHRMTQPADHPVNLYHPEGQYLKGLVLEIG